MNKGTFEIYNFEIGDWEDYTKYAIFPPKFSDLLDETLDEFRLDLKLCPIPYFEPNSLVRISLINTPSAKYDEETANEIIARSSGLCQVGYDTNTKQITSSFTRYMLISSDFSSMEMKLKNKNGDNVYTHELSLIELTKLAESFIGDSISFTNSLGRDFVTEVARHCFFSFSEDKDNPIKSNFYKTPISQEVLETQPFVDFLISMGINLDTTPMRVEKKLQLKEADGSNVYKVEIVGVQNLEYPYERRTYVKDNAATIVKLKETDNKDIGTQFVEGLEIGKTYTIEYVYYIDREERVFSTKIANIENHYPLKKWTIFDVVDRCCDLIEPLRRGEKPRFRLEENIREELDKIISPEFAFTKMTFREQMQQIGGYIHGEFRITQPHFDEDKVWFSFTFDKLGGTDKSWIINRNPISITYKTDINDYCTSLDSQAENVVNQLSWEQGAITEPFVGGIGKSLRTESITTRLSESDSSVIESKYPIYNVGEQFKVYCTNVDEILEDKTIGDIDITPYIFEKVEYDNLSSYDSIFPYSKAYALYYTQGQKNIKGLFFKAEHAISPVFKNYSIINILRQASGRDNINISGQDLMKLAFRITYLPIFNTRVKTNKKLVKRGLPRSLAYNQSANLVESKFYGENLKGTIARMGNASKTLTYHLGHLSDVPKIGMKFDDTYYISAVNTEVLPTYIKCEVALTKHFNRLSQYVGISSDKRMWEVSEKQAFNRESLIEEYILITTNGDKTTDKSSCFVDDNNVAKVLFNQSFTSQYTDEENTIDEPVSACRFTPRDIDGKAIINGHGLILPVVSSTFGNSMVFNFRFEDNYNAGQKVAWVKGDEADNDNVTGYWGAYLPYGDFYGRFYYYDFVLYANNISTGETTSLDLPQLDLYAPANKGFATSGKEEGNAILYRKDSREIPSISYQLSAVTDDESILIGSALMSNCSAVNSNPREYVLMTFDHLLNEIDGKVDYAEGIEHSFTINEDSIVLPKVEREHKSWAIVTIKRTKTINVEAENGEQTTQDIVVGGELVIGQNKPLNEDLTLYFRVKRNIYD